MSDNRIRYLDGLRGVLALIVFIHHFLYIFYPELMLGGDYPEFQKPGITIWKIIALSPVNMLFNPNMAINFFFLLSGYVQSYHYLKNPDLHLLQTSFIKRYFRLVFPTVAVLLLGFVFAKLDFMHKELIPVNHISDGWIKNQMSENPGFLQTLKYGFFDCFQSSRGYYQVLWTMPVELLNSWMVLILLFVTHKLGPKNRFFIFWIIVQAAVLKSTHSISFTTGLLLCSLHLHSPQFKAIFSQPLVKLGCLLLGLYFASYPFIEYQDAIKNSIYKPLSFFWSDIVNFVVGNALLFCLVLHSARIKIISSKKVCQFFGDISFMFYLVHFLLLFSFSPKLFVLLQPNFSFGGALGITFVATFGMITLIAFVFYKYVDKPCLRYCNRYTRKLFEASGD